MCVCVPLLASNLNPTKMIQVMLKHLGEQVEIGFTKAKHGTENITITLLQIIELSVLLRFQEKSLNFVDIPKADF